MPAVGRSRRNLVACVLCLLIVAVALPLPGVWAAQKPDAPFTSAPSSAAQLRAMEGQIKQVVAKVLPCVVGIRVGAGQGSGVIVSPDGYVLTAGHVVGKPGQDVTFIFADGKTAKGKTLGLYRSADAGLMKIVEGGKWPCVDKGTTEAIQPGAWCVAVGHPFGYQEGRPPVVRVGRILQARDNVIQTDCPLIAGDSGGPLFDLAGRVIGINSRIGGATSMNFHVPINVFTDNWDRMVKGDDWQLKLPGRDDAKVKTAFRPLVADVAKCVVRVKCDGKDAALGTIVGPNGWVVTKASELKGKIVCRLRDGKELEAKLIGVCPQFDLAMLKLDIVGLPMIHWARNPNPAVGQWVAAPGMEDDPLAIGVISVPRRKIPPPSGAMGIMIEDGSQGPVIRQVIPKSPAEKVGLRPNDMITHVNGQAVKDRHELVKLVKQHRPGQSVKLGVKRGDQKLELTVTLAAPNTRSAQKRRLQNRSGVGMSKRHDDFPIVLQHDTVLKPADCGGPLVDLSGHAIGINVARGGRTETYTVPVDALVMLMYDMMSGRLPPPKTGAERKAEAAKLAAEKAAKEKAAKEAAEKAAKEKAAKEAAEKAAKEKAAKEAAEKAAKEKAAKEAAERAAKEKAEADRKAKEKAEADKKAAAEKAAREKAEADRKAKEKAEADKKAAEQKAAAEKAAAEKAAKEKAKAEKK